MESFVGSGRIEVCVNNSWGTICSNSWDDVDASVACNQTGYSLYGTVILLNEQQYECINRSMYNLDDIVLLIFLYIYYHIV